MTAVNATCQVLVVGAGPVGLVAGIDLAQRGIDVIVVDRRVSFDPLTVRCNHISSRSMEVFRRLGIADRVRAGGFDDQFPHDVSIRTTLTGSEMGRIPIPGRAGRRRGDPGIDTWWPTAEPPHRMNQIFLEPILQAVAEATPGLRLQFDRDATGITQDGDGVTATVKTSTGATGTIRAAYVIGCDGGASTIRKAIGAKLEGDAVIQRVQSSFIRAPGLTARMQAAPCWGTLCINPHRPGTVYAIDNSDRFLVHNYLRPDEAFDTLDRDACLRVILGVDEAFTYDIIRIEDWIGRRLLADRIARGRVFLAGDAAHIWVPMAGYGMNAGIADATGLTWMLDAVLKGWAAPAMLDAYSAERLPITEQVSRHAMATAETMIRNRAAVPAEIEDQTPEGDAARAWFGRQTAELNTPQYACAGLNFGYFYDTSPIIAYDGATPPAYGMGDYTPSAVPGGRMAHLALPDGATLYDSAGPFYTLVRTDPAAGATMIAAASARGLPLAVVDIAPTAVHDHALYLMRPDQHVAWRGRSAPDDPGAILDRLTGRGG
jgi:2-polyprenyl-6-methoxyphenol hydroxylase-like FAD-dependent oxidoreductase